MSGQQGEHVKIKPTPIPMSEQEQQNAELDRELADTFPASDAPTVTRRETGPIGAPLGTTPQAEAAMATTGKKAKKGKGRK
ncbi:hypothetical protein [Beijerinckia indica]|uniref:Uncharacterized protein n=1 Tax=Beijerinckia indica subsp. indica (strain ATCC 9039 / DSM 1715 / NCIMB 8712) TaxID=395963 RepID=B2IGE9_BEII9|nr:hypothetical protein [Beijerinckia indica]ACB94331.1 hypothetical protein Bind_0681 [Beijerinckia indica subsp. indica ATCC 9039]